MPTGAQLLNLKKAGPAKRQATKPKADRANKQAEVIALMKRAKGTTLAVERRSSRCRACRLLGEGL
jgi:hypothetical protein